MSAINEGKSAYTLGSSPDANPYKKARLQFPTGFRDTSDNRLAALRDLECQWDSGYAIASGDCHEIIETYTVEGVTA